MKLAIIGSRSATDYAVLDAALKTYFATYDDNALRSGYVPRFDEVISGGAVGVDTLAEQAAREWGVKLTVFKPDWERLGKRAGFVRNQDIVAAADVVLALWSGESKGTGHSLSIAKRLKKPTIIIYV